MIAAAGAGAAPSKSLGMRSVVVALVALLMSSTALAHQDTNAVARMDGQARSTGNISFEMDMTLLAIGLYEAEPMVSVYDCEAAGVAVGSVGAVIIAGSMSCELSDGVGPGMLAATFSGEVDATFAFHIEGDIDEGGGRPHDLVCDGQATPSDASGSSFSLSGHCSIE